MRFNKIPITTLKFESVPLLVLLNGVFSTAKEHFSTSRRWRAAEVMATTAGWVSLRSAVMA
jgi:hypothetical protein